MPFTTIPINKPRRSQHNLSYDVKFNCDMGQLIPVMCKRMIPSDRFTVANQCVIRLQPLVAPILQEVNVYVHTFFVPERLLFTTWNEEKKRNDNDDTALQTFLTGGVDGDDDSVLLPRWTGKHNTKFTIWDYLGLPLSEYEYTGQPVNGEQVTPVSFPKRAYNKIWNDYYRDETLQEEVNMDSEEILYRNIKKDYFTSALPWQQRGTSPALPISGLVPLSVIDSSKPFGFLDDVSIPAFTKQFVTLHNHEGSEAHEFAIGARPASDTSTTKPFLDIGSTNTSQTGFDGLSFPSSSRPYNLGSNLSEAVTFDVSDLRLAFQIQKWLERNARGGVRYNEFLLSHYGIAPRDETLQRAVYVGGSRQPLIVSEVAQTAPQASEGGTPQGNLAGKALSAGTGFQGTFVAKEFGWIMSIMSVVPKIGYNGQGLPRELMVDTRYDYPFPEFVSLSEQAVKDYELFVDPKGTTPPSTHIFGYQGRFDEFRHSRSIVCGDMRDKLDYWHLYVNFGNQPALNSDFISWKSKDLKRIFAVQDEPGLIVNYGNVIKAIRPLPYEAVPGLIDHH